jgi:hypothetical protein
MPRRLARYALNALTLLCLLLFIASLYLWHRSHSDGHVFFAATLRDRGEWTFRARHELRVARGVAVFTRTLASGRSPDYRALIEHSLRETPDPPFHRGTTIQSAIPKHSLDPTTCGFAYVHRDPLRDRFACAETHRVTIPLWSLAALTAGPLTLRGSHGLWKRYVLGTGAGLCPHCHYDLRATPDRCPECGHVPRA